MNSQDLLARIDWVIAKGSNVVDGARRQEKGGFLSTWNEPAARDPDYYWIDPEACSEFRTAGLSLLYDLLTEHSPHYRGFDELTNSPTRGSNRKALGIIRGVREEVERGWLVRTRALLAADIFADILEQADYLLSQTYKDASAVLIGGSLEGHLRSLALRHEISTDVAGKHAKITPRPSAAINDDLYKAQAYSRNDHKQVIAWLGIRNSAAHGKYGEYEASHVSDMLSGVRNFIARVPA